MGLGMTASDPCLAGVLHVCSFVLFTIWVTPENRLAKLALRGSSVLTQYFRGPQMARDSGWVKTLSVHVHKPAVTARESHIVQPLECRKVIQLGRVAARAEAAHVTGREN